MQHNRVRVATALGGTLDVSHTRLNTSMCSFLPEVRLMTSALQVGMNKMSGHYSSSWSWWAITDNWPQLRALVALHMHDVLFCSTADKNTHAHTHAHTKTSEMQPSTPSKRLTLTIYVPFLQGMIKTQSQSLPRIYFWAWKAFPLLSTAAAAARRDCLLSQKEFAGEESAECDAAAGCWWFNAHWHTLHGLAGCVVTSTASQKGNGSVGHWERRAESRRGSFHIRAEKCTAV